MEMHLGTKAGRPARLLLVSAGLLAVTIVLAAGQSRLRLRATLDLATEATAIPDTPLHVRLPRDAKAQDRWNKTFTLPAPTAQPIRETGHAGRAIRFVYDRLSGYVSPTALFKELKRQDPAAEALSEPARIGPLTALDVISEHMIDQHSVMVTYRLACSQRGDMVRVEYMPLSDWTPSERRVLDAICATVTLDGISGGATPAQLQLRAGLKFDVAPNWRMTGPEFAEVPGLYIGAEDAAGPGWVLGLVRTWVPDSAPAQSILLDMATRLWERGDEEVQARSSEGREFYWVDAPHPEDLPGEATGLGLVSTGGGAAAWVFAYGAAGDSKAAAAKIVDSLHFAEVPLLANLDQAAARGDEFVRSLTEQGASPWWRESSQTRYVTLRSGSHHGGGLRSRDPLLGGRAGYQGFEAYAFDDADLRRRVAWQCDAGAQAFQYEVEDDLPGRGGGMYRNLLRESRTTNESQVQRTVQNGRRPLQQSIDVGSRFVPRPLESLAEQNVAMKNDAAVLIDVANTKSPGTLPRLLRNLPPDAAGLRRALAVGPDEPWGAVSGFDANGELVYRHAASEWVDAATRDAAEEASPALREMLRRQGVPN